MIKLLLSLVGGVMLTVALCANSQEPADDEELKLIDKAISEQSIDVAQHKPDEVSREEALWEAGKTDQTIEGLRVYLEEFPSGAHSKEARSKIQTLEIVARVRADDDKELDAYRKRRNANGLLLELAAPLNDVRPYVRSMLNSCGYQLVEPHRFAKRVYPTLVLDGQMFTSKSDSEYVVTLDLSLILKTKTREIKARQKMRSYRTSEIDTHKALVAGFEDVGAQMKSDGFCILSR